MAFRPEVKVVRIAHIIGSTTLRVRITARQGNQMWIVVQAQGNDVSEILPDRRKIEGYRLVDFSVAIMSKFI